MDKQNLLTSVLADIKLYVAERSDIQACMFLLNLDGSLPAGRDSHYKVPETNKKIPRNLVSEKHIQLVTNTTMSVDRLNQVRADLADVLSDATHLWRGELCRIHERFPLDGVWEATLVSSNETCPQQPTFKILCIR